MDEEGRFTWYLPNRLRGTNRSHSHAEGASMPFTAPPLFSAPHHTRKAAGTLHASLTWATKRARRSMMRSLLPSPPCAASRSCAAYMGGGGVGAT